MQSTLTSHQPATVSSYTLDAMSTKGDLNTAGGCVSAPSSAATSLPASSLSVLIPPYQIGFSDQSPETAPCISHFAFNSTLALATSAAQPPMAVAKLEDGGHCYSAPPTRLTFDDTASDPPVFAAATTQKQLSGMSSTAVINATSNTGSISGNNSFYAQNQQLHQNSAVRAAEPPTISAAEYNALVAATAMANTSTLTQMVPVMSFQNDHHHLANSAVLCGASSTYTPATSVQTSLSHVAASLKEPTTTATKPGLFANGSPDTGATTAAAVTAVPGRPKQARARRTRQGRGTTEHKYRHNGGSGADGASAWKKDGNANSNNFRFEHVFSVKPRPPPITLPSASSSNALNLQPQVHSASSLGIHSLGNVSLTDGHPLGVSTVRRATYNLASLQIDPAAAVAAMSAFPGMGTMAGLETPPPLSAPGLFDAGGCQQQVELDGVNATFSMTHHTSDGSIPPSIYQGFTGPLAMTTSFIAHEIQQPTQHHPRQGTAGDKQQNGHMLTQVNVGLANSYTPHQSTAGYPAVNATSLLLTPTTTPTLDAAISNHQAYTQQQQQQQPLGVTTTVNGLAHKLPTSFCGAPATNMEYTSVNAEMFLRTPTSAMPGHQLPTEQPHTLSAAECREEAGPGEKRKGDVGGNQSETSSSNGQELNQAESADEDTDCDYGCATPVSSEPAQSLATTPTTKRQRRSAAANGGQDKPLIKCSHPGCNLFFSRAYNLKSHERTHTNERPYKCETCGQPFSRNHDLKRHIKIHTGDRPFRCPFCNRGFARADALSRHTSKGHSCKKAAIAAASASAIAAFGSLGAATMSMQPSSPSSLSHSVAPSIVTTTGPAAPPMVSKRAF